MKIKLTPKNNHPAIYLEVNIVPPSPPTAKAEIENLFTSYQGMASQFSPYRITVEK